MTPGKAQTCLHASAVAIAGRGLMILGASGRGKSALALQLMALGAGLIADDRTLIHKEDEQLMLSCPAGIRGQIEARHVGLLRAVAHPPAALGLVVDLDRTEQDRLPALRFWDKEGIQVPLLYGVPTPSFPAALHHYMREGRHA